MFDILTIGTATLDTFIEARFLKTVSDPKHLTRIGFKTGAAQCFSLGSKIEIPKPLITVGGGAVNAAVTFSRAGFKVATLAQTGRDYAGKLIVEALEKEHISSLVAQDQKGMTALSYILIGKTGERTILIHRGSSSDFSSAHKLMARLASRWAYIVPGAMSLSLLNDFYRVLKKNNIAIALAPSKDFIAYGLKRCASMLKATRVITLNREEASYFTGVPYTDKKGIFKKLDAAIDGIVVMTDGKKGATVSNGKIIWDIVPFKEKKIVDQTGAGDAFGSGFVAGLMEKEDKNHRITDEMIDYAIRRAMANAISVIEHRGATEGVLTLSSFKKNKRWTRPISVRHRVCI